VQRCIPLYKDAARPHRRRVGTRWAVDETSIRLAGRWVYADRAIDAHGQVIDVYLSETRDTAAATAFFAQASARTDVRPHRVTTDKAPTYPPALQAVVPEAEHVTGKMEQQGIERDHQHLKGRTRCMRGFQQLGCAQVVCDGHGFMRNLRDGFYHLGEPPGDPRLPQAPRLTRAWDDLTQILAAASLSLSMACVGVLRPAFRAWPQHNPTAPSDLWRPLCPGGDPALLRDSRGLL